MSKISSKVAERFVNENIKKNHWNINKDKKSFDNLQNHLINTTNMFNFFYKAISEVLDFHCPEGLIIADIGGGVGWTSSILASFPQIKKIYLVDPSTSRLEKAKFISDHYGLDKSKIIIIKGEFLNFNLPEKVDVVILNGAFHHCFDKDVDGLFKNIRLNLNAPKIIKYINYQGLEQSITQKSQILIAGEHYLYKKAIYKRFFMVILSSLYIIKPKKDINGESYRFGNLNPPNYFSGEHERTKKQIFKLFNKNNFKFKFFEHSEDNLKNKKKFLSKRKLNYFYAILK